MFNRENALRILRLHADDIARTGTLELRSDRGSDPVYCARFRCCDPVTDTVRQRRLTIGDDPELHDIVRNVIRTRVLKKRQAKTAKAEAAKRHQRARAAEAAFMAEHPGSRRFRQRVRRAYRESQATGDDFLTVLLLMRSDRPTRKRPGRPLKSRLW